VLQTGGVQRQPPRRALWCLSTAEREEISRGVAAGQPCRQIVARLGRAPSTVSRELARNGGRGRYRAQVADAAALRRAQRPKAAKLVLEPRLRAVVEAKLAPGVVAPADRRLAAAGLPPGSGDGGVARDHLPVAVHPAPEALRRELQRCLRTGRAMRSPRGKRLPQGRGQLRDTLHISQRPEEAADRAVPGHWEGDLVLASGPAQSGPWSSATAAMWCCSRSRTDAPPSACARN
jgi:IS30 family transposase